MMIQGGHRLGVLTGTTRLHFALHAAAARQGFVLVPVPMRDPPEQMAAHLDDARVDVLVTDPAHAKLAEQIRSGRPALLCDDQGDPQGHLEGPLDPPRDSPEHLAVLRTGGTTGAPRLVTVPRAALAHHRRAAMGRLGCDEESIWLGCLPLWHMGGVAMADRCLHGGGRLVLQDGFDVETTKQALAEHDVTHTSLVPTMLARLLTADVAPPASLRCVLVGGDRLSPELAQRALAAGWPVHASYGLTEACSQVATAAPDELRDHPGTVGRPLDGVTVTIDDGEIIVDGPTLATEGPLRTGDLGRLDDDGRLYVLGRSDDVVVTGGEKVAPARVEEALERHPGVAEAAVVGVPDEEWGQRVVALIVAADGAQPGSDALREHARGLLAAHEVPKSFVFRDALPRTGAGKLRRAALRSESDL